MSNRRSYWFVCCLILSCCKDAVVDGSRRNNELIDEPSSSSFLRRRNDDDGHVSSMLKSWKEKNIERPEEYTNNHNENTVSSEDEFDEIDEDIKYTTERELTCQKRRKKRKKQCRKNRHLDTCRCRCRTCPTGFIKQNGKCVSVCQEAHTQYSVSQCRCVEVTLPPSQAPSLEVPTNTRSSSMILALLPDTQFYSEGAPYIFVSQTKWLANATRWSLGNDGKAGILGNKTFVLHLGDVVQNPMSISEWNVASYAMSFLENGGDDGDDKVIMMSHNLRGKEKLVSRDAVSAFNSGEETATTVSFSLVPGNHDVIDTRTDFRRWKKPNKSPREPYPIIFSESRAMQHRSSTFQSRDTYGYSEYHIVRIPVSGTRIPDGMMKLLILSLDWRPSSMTLKWAKAILKKHDSIPAIVASHEYARALPGGEARRSEHGNTLWNTLIKSSNQVFMTVNGHFSGSGSMIDRNDEGNEVLSYVVNYQNRYGGGNGYLRLLELDLVWGSVEHLTFSPYVMELYEEGGVENLSPFDEVQLRGSSDSFTTKFNLAKRMSSIMGYDILPPKTNPPQPKISLLDPVREEISLVPRPVPLSEKALPASVEDFPLVNETLAHWRFHGRRNNLPVRKMIRDASGNGNFLKRIIVQTGNSTILNQNSMMRYSTSHHPLSSSSGSICFADVMDKNGDLKWGGYSYLSTIIQKPSSELMNVSFPNGYTIEAFVKIDENWEKSLHGDTALFSRRGTILDRGSGILNNAPPSSVVDGTKVSNIFRSFHTNNPHRHLSSSTTTPISRLGFTTRRELHYLSQPITSSNTENQASIKTSYTSPIKPNRWFHIAVVVNDPQFIQQQLRQNHKHFDVVTIYVDGHRARRDPSIHHPLQANYDNVSDGDFVWEDMMNSQWVFGGETPGGTTRNDRRPRVFGNACLGEVRVVGRVLRPDEFLINRRQ